MIKDYSGSCIAINSRNINSRNKKLFYRKKTASKSREFFSATRLMWNTLGGMLLVTVVIGITSTIWYGWQVQLALDQIGGTQITNTSLTDENRLLVAQRDLMLTLENMEKTAQRIGLYSPTKSQLRYP